MYNRPVKFFASLLIVECYKSSGFKKKFYQRLKSFWRHNARIWSKVNLLNDLTNYYFFFANFFQPELYLLKQWATSYLSLVLFCTLWVFNGDGFSGCWLKDVYFSAEFHSPNRLYLRIFLNKVLSWIINFCMIFILREIWCGRIVSEWSHLRSISETVFEAWLQLVAEMKNSLNFNESNNDHNC